MDEAERFPPDDPREWLGRARSNLRMAAARLDGVYLEDRCCQAQEAAEKAVKAVMIARDVRFPYVHDLKELLDTCERAGLPVAPAVRAAATAAARQPYERYPHRKVVTEAEYDRTVAGAETLVSWAAAEVGSWRPATGTVREPPPAVYPYDPPAGEGGRPDPAVLTRLVDLIVAAARPDRILLFGSGARGTMGPGSDLDVMVVKSEPFDREAIRTAIRSAMWELKVPVDVVLATPADLERYGRSWSLVYCPALEEGRVIYEQWCGPRAAR